MEIIKIAISLYEQLLITSVTLPIEMLKAGEAYAKRHKGQNFKPLAIECLSEDGNNITTSVGINMAVHSDFQSLNSYDYIIVPSIWRNPRPVVRHNPQLATNLAFAWERGATIIGVGTGVCFLAESGMLNGHSATTHWHYANQFMKSYPAVELKPDYFITQSDRLYTVASLNALADVVVHLIGQFYGKDAANHVQQNFSHEIRKPYEEQRYLEGAVDRHSDEQIAAIQFWLKNNASSALSLAEVAQQFGISYRSFNRRFKAATGKTAIAYLQEVRLQQACELLASSNLSIQEVALTVGFNSQSQLSRAFKEQMNQTPSAYRKIVRKKLFS
ncbi:MULTISPECIES: GlxA family transcriptional regulator [Pseudoalteromonas]|uniref:Helix-turn-helix domain-containing protein n=1 Tax=Pseudoalteromonas obscura TaxID=3048491 RepID=A0ABT7EJE0_9GAMM|nr:MULTISPECIES: helix-turn-helix domain-containing protein [Pseudoalteromonas]MDK2595154.1 helix-turn-helix domain-containing protein [Pseudoalteromonas sp. P94(2023)]